MRNLNKSNVLTSTESINRTLKKKKVEKNNLKIHSFSILSDDRSKASSKTTPPHSAI